MTTPRITTDYTDKEGNIICDPVLSTVLQKRGYDYLTRLLKLSTSHRRDYLVATRFLELDENVLRTNTTGPWFSIRIIKVRYAPGPEQKLVNNVMNIFADLSQNKIDNLDYEMGGNVVDWSKALHRDIKQMAKDMKAAYPELPDAQDPKNDVPHNIEATNKGPQGNQKPPQNWEQHRIEWRDAERVRKNASEFFSKEEKAANNPPGQGALMHPTPQGSLLHSASHNISAFENSPAYQSSAYQPSSYQPLSSLDMTRASAAKLLAAEQAAAAPPPKSDNPLSHPYEGKTFQQAQEILVSSMKEAVALKDDEDEEESAQTSKGKGKAVEKLRFNSFLNLPSRDIKDYYNMFHTNVMSVNKLAKGIDGFRSKIDNNVGVSIYRTWDALLDAASIIWKNAKVYNEDDSPVYKQAVDLEDYFMERFNAAKAVVADESTKIVLKLRTSGQNTGPAPFASAKSLSHELREAAVNPKRTRLRYDFSSPGTYPVVGPNGTHFTETSYRALQGNNSAITADLLQHVNEFGLPHTTDEFPESRDVDCQQDLFENGATPMIPGISAPYRFYWKLGKDKAPWTKVAVGLHLNGADNNPQEGWIATPYDDICSLHTILNFDPLPALPICKVIIFTNAGAIGTHRLAKFFVNKPEETVTTFQVKNFPIYKEGTDWKHGPYIEYLVPLKEGWQRILVECMCAPKVAGTPMTRGNEREVERLVMTFNVIIDPSLNQIDPNLK
ncbi:MAG: hypothetical protein M1814_005877 [Vezdaea aestivalis]|nr:MAG: hypothetical protein M1814_005877 [Vezdaea aestivalis]